MIYGFRMVMSHTKLFFISTGFLLIFLWVVPGFPILHLHLQKMEIPELRAQTFISEDLEAVISASTDAYGRGSTSLIDI